MTLNELVETKYPKVTFIGLYEKDEYGNLKTIYPEYTDEMLETHGDYEVVDYYYSKKRDVLVVELKED